MEGTVKTDSIMEAMQKAIAEIPPDKKGKVSFKVTMSDAEATFTYKFKDVEAGAYVSRTWNGKVQAGGRVTWEF